MGILGDFLCATLGAGSAAWDDPAPLGDHPQGGGIENPWDDPAPLGGLSQAGRTENPWERATNLWDFGNYKEMESPTLEMLIR